MGFVGFMGFMGFMGFNVNGVYGFRTYGISPEPSYIGYAFYDTDDRILHQLTLQSSIYTST
jgi:hypothetical protein